MWGQRKDVALSVAITSFLMLITFALLNPLTRPAPEIIEAGCPEIANTTTTTTTTTTTEAPVVERFGPTNVKEILPAFRNFQSQIRFADRYGLATCVIPKTMSTVMANVMCYLYDPQGFGKNNRSVIHDGFWTSILSGGSGALTDKGGPIRGGRIAGTATGARIETDHTAAGHILKC
uniref:Amidase domain-containing protein n=1 Tax=Bursaphelenchus xylophilus TaxID=6326 RepID=A0A1I7SH39_BURXY